MDFYGYLFSPCSKRWSKGGIPISEANGDSLEVTVDQSYFTDPVSCEVSNSVGSTNVSTLVDVQCEYSTVPGLIKLLLQACIYHCHKQNLQAIFFSLFMFIQCLKEPAALCVQCISTVSQFLLVFEYSQSKYLQYMETMDNVIS